MSIAVRKALGRNGRYFGDDVFGFQSQLPVKDRASLPARATLDELARSYNVSRATISRLTA